MSLHKKPRGRALIKALLELGVTLGYEVQGEYAVGKKHSVSQEIDVAWFTDRQLAPLFIFEIESATTNTAANNAIKVLLQPNTVLEKPLFFFHILMSGGGRSSIPQLLAEFGKYNYRVYRWHQNEQANFICDVLQQHRRINKRLKTLKLFEALRVPAWKGVGLEPLFEKLLLLDFHESLPAAYATLALEDNRFKPIFLDTLLSSISTHDVPRYETFLGDSWGKPIELSILYREGRIGTVKFRNQFLSWIKPTNHGPHPFEPMWGNSRDFDEFLLGFAAGYLAALAAISGHSQKIRSLCAAQLDLIAATLRRSCNSRRFIDIWILHLEGRGGDASRFERARRRLNERNGMPEDMLFSPPLVVSPEDDLMWANFDARPGDEVPAQELFAEEALIALPKPGSESSFAIGLFLLTANDLSSTRDIGRIVASLLCHNL